MAPSAQDERSTEHVLLRVSERVCEEGATGPGAPGLPVPYIPDEGTLADPAVHRDEWHPPIGIIQLLTHALRRPSQGRQRATAFGRDDLPLVAKVADHRHTWIHDVAKNDRLYHACTKCTPKWFAHAESGECPRCGSDQICVTQEGSPWDAQRQSASPL